MTAQVGDILKEREQTHGSFDLNSEVFCKIVEAVNDATLKCGATWNPVQFHAFSNIATKLARMASSPGGPGVREHWADICGYSTLVLERMEDKDDE